MFTQTEVKDLLNTYLTLFPAEAQRIQLFSDYAARTETQNLYNRKNFDGHITTSAFIVNRSTREILLLKHKSLNRWLQPGGHVEQDDTLIASALREAEEETGILVCELSHIAITENSDVPFDIDPHYIPPNPKKQEEGHYHHDVRYLFAYTGNGNHEFNTEESTGLKWVPFHELSTDETFGHVIKKIELYL